MPIFLVFGSGNQITFILQETLSELSLTERMKGCGQNQMVVRARLIK